MESEATVLPKVNYSKERKIEVLYNEVKKAFLKDFLESITNEETRIRLQRMFSKSMNSFNWTYWRVKDKFKYTHRDDGKRYLEHVVWVFQIYANTFSNIKKDLEKLDVNNKQKDLIKAISIINNELDRVLIALDHDTIEDTDISFESLKEIHWNEIALAVFLISKPSYLDFIHEEKEKKIVKKLQKKGILNSKCLISDKIKAKLFIEKNSKTLSKIDKITIFKWNDYKITKEEERGIKEYQKIKENNKPVRNYFYFKKMKSYKSMYKYATSLNKKYNLLLNKEKLERITKNAIYIKLSDRINNLSDMKIAWKDDPERIETKLIETEKKLLPIAKELNKKAYKVLKEKIEEVKGIN